MPDTSVHIIWTREHGGDNETNFTFSSAEWDLLPAKRQVFYAFDTCSRFLHPWKETEGKNIPVMIW